MGRPSGRPPTERERRGLFSMTTRGRLLEGATITGADCSYIRWCTLSTAAAAGLSRGFVLPAPFDGMTELNNLAPVPIPMASGAKEPNMGARPVAAFAITPNSLPKSLYELGYASFNSRLMACTTRMA